MKYISSATAFSTATATASASASATATASASSDTSQEDANNLAIQNAELISTQLAYSNALNQLTPQTPQSSTYYVALLFTELSYKNGINDTLELIQKEFPDANVVFEKYVIDGSIEITDKVLTDFITKYPSGNRANVSELTSILNESSLFFQKKNLDILSLSVSATSVTIRNLQNALTYGYFLDKSVMSSFLLIKDYNIKNIVILKEKITTNAIYYANYSDVTKEQNKLLYNLPVYEYELDVLNLNPLYIPENSIVYLLADTGSVTNTYINQIKQGFKNNTTSFIFGSNTNYNIGDIFGDIPAMVFIPHPMNYTTTSNKVFNNLKDKINYVFRIYPFYDILYTLQFMSSIGTILNKNNYVNTNAFQSIPEAYSNSIQLDTNINGFDYGNYDVIFTKNSILDTTELQEIYNKYNSTDGTIFRLPQSQSIFCNIGIVPFFASEVYYLDQNLIQIYQNDILKYVKFHANITKDEKGDFIAVSEIQQPKFIINYDNNTGLFSYLEKIYNDKQKTNPKVNLRMSKVDTIKYL